MAAREREPVVLLGATVAALVVSGIAPHDRFTWFCARCGVQLHESVKQVADYRDDPVSRAYAEFYDSEKNRTCGRCGHVTPRPT